MAEQTTASGETKTSETTITQTMQSTRTSFFSDVLEPKERTPSPVTTMSTSTGTIPRTVSVSADETKLQVEVLATECKVESVIVYLDRAEVCRSLKVKLRPGENEVIIKNISSCIDRDSIRVDGRGPAVISEVSFQAKHLAGSDVEINQKQKELKDKLVPLEKKKASAESKRTRLQKQRDVLFGFADNLMQPAEKADKEGNNKNLGSILDKSLLDGMNGFFEMFERQGTRLDETIQEVQQEVDKLTEAIEVIYKNMATMNVSKEESQARQISVLLDVKETAEVELRFSYVVSKAKWLPKYDIRVYSSDNQMKIMYYGMIQQATGEDWNDAKLSLSTAMPSVGGTVPDLGTQRLNFKPKANLDLIMNGIIDLSPTREKIRGSARKKLKRPQSILTPLDLSKSLDEALAPLDVEKYKNYIVDEESIQDVPLKVKESITSTTYEVARTTTIPCDNTSHKVSLAIIDLAPVFEYESVPKKAAHAYLKARVKNTSQYALLAGPTNIFLDNNFIAKAELKAVSPSEDFTCSLGVDPGVRVDYKPLHKFREQGGVISKTVAMTYKQVIEVKNTHQEVIKIQVNDQLPLSTEEKIKVNLQEPVIKHPEKYDKSKPIRINKQNNVEWDLEINPGESKEVTLKYVVEYPVNEDVETSVFHLNESLV